MHVCVCVRASVCVRVHACVHEHMFLCVCMYVCVHVCVGGGGLLTYALLIVCVCTLQVIVHRIGPGMVQQIQRQCSFCRGQGEMFNGKGAERERERGRYV